MIVPTRNYFRFAFAWLSVIGFIVFLQSPPAQAYPDVIGEEIDYHGGSLQFEILPSDAAYTSQVYLHTATGSVFLGNNTNTGLVINLGDPGVFGLNPGDELIVGIHVPTTGNYFVVGSGVNNPDGVAHASVSYPYNQIANIEDLFGGGDRDYNDVRLRVLGHIGIAQFSEPAALLLVASGIGAFRFFRHRSA